MKLSLVVTSQGKAEGKVIPITLSQFLIGRDPQCHLRPVSAMISKRHCAVLVKGAKVYLRDFDSTNGSFINDKQVKGEAELHNDDRLQVGPLSFVVKIETTVPVNKPTPVPPAAASVGSEDDESVAAMLLSLQDDEGSASSGPLGSDGVPQGSTVLDILSPTGKDDTGEKEPVKGDPKKDPAKPASGNTSSAAKAILEKYTRRNRT
jgi:pSer/pThr/pTyr-binding forkhead associated (FHA) protein